MSYTVIALSHEIFRRVTISTENPHCKMQSMLMLYPAYASEMHQLLRSLALPVRLCAGTLEFPGRKTLLQDFC